MKLFLAGVSLLWFMRYLEGGLSRSRSTIRVALPDRDVVAVFVIVVQVFLPLPFVSFSLVSTLPSELPLPTINMRS